MLAFLGWVRRTFVRQGGLCVDEAAALVGSSSPSSSGSPAARRRPSSARHPAKSRGFRPAAGIVDPDSVPSTSIDRRARLWLELSRAYEQQKDWTGALGALRTATSISEESMRCRPLSRNLASELVIHGGKLIARESRALATRLGLTV